MVNFHRFAEVHHSLVVPPRNDRHLTLLDDVATLVRTYYECGGTRGGPEHSILVACIYALQERLGHEVIKQLVKLEN